MPILDLNEKAGATPILGSEETLFSPMKSEESSVKELEEEPRNITEGIPVEGFEELVEETGGTSFKKLYKLEEASFSSGDEVEELEEEESMVMTECAG